MKSLPLKAFILFLTVVLLSSCESQNFDPPKPLSKPICENHINSLSQKNAESNNHIKFATLSDLITRCDQFEFIDLDNVTMELINLLTVDWSRFEDALTEEDYFNLRSAGHNENSYAQFILGYVSYHNISSYEANYLELSTIKASQFWFNRSSMNKNPWAQEELANMYFGRQIGWFKDWDVFKEFYEKKAYRLNQQAEKSFLRRAQNGSVASATAYYYAAAGIVNSHFINLSDTERLRLDNNINKFTQYAAENGSMLAQYNHGFHLLRVENDIEAAQFYFKLAAKQGHHGALRFLIEEFNLEREYVCSLSVYFGC